MEDEDPPKIEETVPFLEPDRTQTDLDLRVGDRVTDPEVLAAIGEEREIGRTGRIQPRTLSAAEQTERQAAIDSLDIS